VYDRITTAYPDDTILLSQEDIFSHDYHPGQQFHVLSHGDLPVASGVALHRWYHLFLASRGARFWLQDTPAVAAPTYAGTFSPDEATLDKIVVDAVFAENRATLFHVSGVSYIGRTFGDPRTAILVDYKGDKTHNPTDDVCIHDILCALPEDTGSTSEPHDWRNFAIISTSNVEKLAGFIDELSETDVLAYSPGAVAKLTHIGRDFGHIGKPKPDKSYGLTVRETASRMKPVF
jgi:hypothetical protein